MTWQVYLSYRRRTERKKGDRGQEYGEVHTFATLPALVLVTAARATADAAEHDTDLEQCLRDMVTATGPLRTGDTDIEVLMKLLDIRTRACELLDLDPAGHDWTHTPSTDDAPTP